MRLIDPIEESIADYIKIANQLKASGLTLTDFEAMKLAIEMFKAESLESISELVVLIDDQQRPFKVKIETE